MTKKHMKRQTAPRTWAVPRKGSKFISRADPGKKKELAMPVSLVFKNILKVCRVTKEVKNVLNDKEIIIDGKRRKETRYPIGIFDVLELGDKDETYRMVLSHKGKLTLVKIPIKEAQLKPCKIIKKSTLSNKKIQLNFEDGRNLVIPKNDYKVGDALLIDISKNKIVESLSFAKGNYVLLTGGKHIGNRGVIDSMDKDIITFQNPKKEKISTDKKHAFVIGKGKPAITIENVTDKN